MATIMPSNPTSSAVEGLTEVMAKLWKTGERSYLTIACGAEVFNVHSLILCPRSKFFAAAYDGNFLEATTKRVELPDDKPSMVKRMLQFCYGIEYSHDKDADGGPSRAQTNAEVYALAGKYEIDGLKMIAKAKFSTVLDEWAAIDAIPPFATLVSMVYGSTPDSDRALRDILVGYTQKKWKMLGINRGIKGILARNPGLALDLINSTPMTVKETIYKDKCKKCGATDKWKFDRVKCSCNWYEHL